MKRARNELSVSVKLSSANVVLTGANSPVIELFHLPPAAEDGSNSEMRLE